MAQDSESAVKSALIANGVIMLIKLVGAVMSGSASMMAEFKHSIGDWANSFFLLIGLKQAQKPGNERYQFGHGKRVFFWSFLASMGMLFIGGAMSVVGGVQKIIYPEELAYVGLNLIIIAVSAGFELYSFRSAIKAILQEGGVEVHGWRMLPRVIPLLANSTPATRFIFFEDSAALVGLSIAAAAIGLSYYTGNTIFDGIASIIIGIMLFLIGLTTAMQNAAAILGEAADPELIQDIGNYTYAMTGVKDVHSIRSMCIGPNTYLLEMVIEADEMLRLAQSGDIGEAVGTHLKDRFSEVGYVHVAVIADDCRKDWVIKT